MNITEIEELSDKNSIVINEVHLKNIKGFSIDNNIVIDKSHIENSIEYREVLAHEVGHCLKGAFYPLSACSKLNRLNIDKMERMARNCACRLLVSIDELKSALKKATDDYSLAEILDVDIPTLTEIFTYYKEKQLI